jgi:hypothetical protein
MAITLTYRNHFLVTIPTNQPTPCPKTLKTSSIRSIIPSGLVLRLNQQNTIIKQQSKAQLVAFLSCPVLSILARQCPTQCPIRPLDRPLRRRHYFLNRFVLLHDISLPPPIFNIPQKLHENAEMQKAPERRNKAEKSPGPNSVPFTTHHQPTNPDQTPKLKQQHKSDAARFACHGIEKARTMTHNAETPRQQQNQNQKPLEKKKTKKKRLKASAQT